MPIVNNNLFEDGDIPTAAELNQPYDDTATASGALDTTNTADNWITVEHLQSAPLINKLYNFSYDGVVSDLITSQTYVTINNIGNSEVTLNYQPTQYEILRIESCGLQSGSDAAATYDNAVPSGDRNYYAFRLLLTYNDGGGALTKTIGEWGYTFTSMAGGNSRYYTAANGLAENTGVPLAYQTFQFSELLRYDGTTGVRTYEKIELQAKVNYNVNTLKVSRNNIIAVRAQR